MTTQNPDLVRIQDIPNVYVVIHKDNEIEHLRNVFGIKQQFYYLFVKIVDNVITSIYGSYGHRGESEIYHVVGDRIA